MVSGDPSSGSNQTFYDTAGRCYKEQYPDGKLVIAVLDGSGNTTKLTYPDGYYVTRVFDQLNRLIDIKLNGATAAAAHFAYDELSRRTTLTYNNGTTVTYGYTSTIVDDMASIAHAFVGSSVTLSYGYDNDHEINSHGVTDNTFMWYPTTGTVPYGTASSVNEYPTVGGATYSYNTNGCLSGDGTWTYTYDTENHLTAASKTGTSVSYLYDSLHRQAQKTVGTIKSRYIYSGWQRIADYDGTAGTLQTRYVYGDMMDEPLMQIASSGAITYYHANYQGSIIGVSSSAGAILNKNSYGPFGESVAIAGTTLGFTGQRYDADTALYYYKLRYYSPATGRFLQPDPIKYADGLNLYAYVNNSPLWQTDPYGLAGEGLTPTNTGDGTSGDGDGGGNQSFSMDGPHYLSDLTQFIPNLILDPVEIHHSSFNQVGISDDDAAPIPTRREKKKLKREIKKEQKEFKHHTFKEYAHDFVKRLNDTNPLEKTLMPPGLR